MSSMEHQISSSNSNYSNKRKSSSSSSRSNCKRKSSSSPSSPLSVTTFLSSFDAGDEDPTPPLLSSSQAVADLIAWASEAAHLYHTAKENTSKSNQHQNYSLAHEEYLKAVETANKIDDPAVHVALDIAAAIVGRKELPVLTVLPPDTSPATSHDSSGPPRTSFSKKQCRRQLDGFVELPIDVEDGYDSDGEATVISRRATKAKNEKFMYNVGGCPACYARFKSCPGDCLYITMCRSSGHDYCANLRMYKNAKSFMADDHEALTSLLQKWGPELDNMNRLFRYLSGAFRRGERLESKEEAKALCQLENDVIRSRLKEIKESGKFF